MIMVSVISKDNKIRKLRDQRYMSTCENNSKKFFKNCFHFTCVEKVNRIITVVSLNILHHMTEDQEQIPNADDHLLCSIIVSFSTSL